MRKITVNASRQYEIIISRDIIKNAGEFVAGVHKKCKAMIISDSNVFPLYCSTVKKSLEENGFESFTFCFEAGEERKNISTLNDIWNALAQNQFTRSDLIVALGGGVCGDISGFAAASYLRGIEFVQIPTSLLAMTDSSVGGKTAIDLEYGKNLVGAFWQPSLVLCDPNVLDTLSKHYYSDGMAEVIKYGMINRPVLLESLEGDFDIEDIIEICARDKREIVEADEHDNAARKLLNFGHTFGHSIEKLSDFTITHGFAVAMGMKIITKACENMNLCEKGAYEKLCTILAKFALDNNTTYSAEAIADAAMLDKKTSGERISLVIPTKTGCCELFDTTKSELLKFTQAGLE